MDKRQLVDKIMAPILAKLLVVGINLLRARLPVIGDPVAAHRDGKKGEISNEWECQQRIAATIANPSYRAYHSMFGMISKLSIKIIRL